MTIKNGITAHIDSSLGSMSIANGYNFDWTAWNVFNPDDRSYPAGKSVYVTSENEENQQSNKYTSIMRGIFTVTVDDSADVDLLMSKVDEDIKRMFNDQYENLRQKGMLPGVQHGGSDETYKLNKLRPGTIVMPWDLPYRVSMDNPSST